MNKIPHDPNEILAIVNKKDKIIGKGTRVEIHKKGLIHREVIVYLINSNKEVLLQLRKDIERYDHSSAGHFGYNQDYKEAAQREFFEELGVKLNLDELEELDTEILRSKWKGKINFRIAKIFIVRKDITEFNIYKEELLDVKFFNKKEIIELLKNPEKLTKSGFQIISKHILKLI